MENLEDICLEKLNKILSEFDLQVSVVHNEPISGWKYVLSYDNCDENWIVGYWTSIFNMMFEKQKWTIFDCLQHYHEFPKSRSSSPQYKKLSDAYSAVKCLQSNSLEEFVINCDLIGV